MKYLLLMVVLLVGCSPPNKEYRIVCDKGFTSPWADYGAWIETGGTISWKVTDRSPWYQRKMTEGETCWRETRLTGASR